ncbi:protein EARLY FLOWERING 3 [Salvia miltiorrhiza]|uniref:protein EARLY FLOWERING 3 n=1 Tax=Salvia miltiorrhiza TaxID=226208 RepID=UPI0025AD5AA2|nr:protein EARLY FLOWERING 3 [Salvia miltiorrhiza]
MKRGNDEEKIMGPMFPRLHVNDTEKGGPRAPPRNKMALYEQLSIPSQRFSHSVLTRNLSNSTASFVPPSSQGGGNDRGMFFARQLHPIHPSEMQYSQYSELSPPLAQGEQRKKMDEDDYTVPIFIQPVPAEFNKYSNGMCQQKFSPSNPPYFHSSSKFQKANETGMFDHSVGQEEGSKKGENSNESVAGQKQTVSSISHEPGSRLRTDDRGQQELCAESRLSGDSLNTEGTDMAAGAKTNSPDSEEASLLGDDNIIHDLSDDTGSHEDESCRPPLSGSLQRGDSVSVSSILDTESALDITPDNIVGILGQKHFWKARRAIMNQQRVFAVQLFELHRLIKVQKMIAAWPHLMLEDSGIFDKPTKPIIGKKRPLDSAVNAASNASKAKGNSDNPSHKKERSAENTLEKVPYSAAQNGVPPSSCRPSADSAPSPPAVTSNDHNNVPPSSCRPSADSAPSPPAVTSNDHNNAQVPRFNHPEGHQWLIPVMSPSEGLVYKPYPAPGFSGQGCGGSGPPRPNPMTGNFLAPVFGVPTPMPQYPFPPYAPHGYFPPYGMPMMSTAAFSGSSMEQMNPHSVPGHFSARESASAASTQNYGPVPDGLDRRAAEEIEVQGSSSSSPSESQPPSTKVNSSVGGANILPILPTPSRAIDASKSSPRVRAPRVIKVVPRNGVSASESAARIFRSIQQERMQYDSV